MIDWIKKNWLILLLVLLGFYILRSVIGVAVVSRFASNIRQNNDTAFDMTPQLSYSGKTSLAPAVERFEAVAPSTSTNRLVIRDTSLSLLVKDAPKVIEQIQQTAQALGGFLVDSSLSRPEVGASGQITVRVPEDKRDEALAQFKALSVKVVSESVTGYDVTDQYEDLSERLRILNQTKTKFESILDQATQVKDLLEVQRELVNLQSQIDSVTSRQQYLSQTSRLAKISIYLSTDELSLPYAPSSAWRPLAVFKQAVRSLLTSLRDIGSMAIWALVYLPLLIPFILLFIFLKKRFFPKSK